MQRDNIVKVKLKNNQMQSFGRQVLPPTHFHQGYIPGLSPYQNTPSACAVQSQGAAFIFFHATPGHRNHLE
jgi:hypothetical protein